MGARLAWKNFLLKANALAPGGSVITSSSEATGYSMTNLWSPYRWKNWRSAVSTSDQWVVFNMAGFLNVYQVVAAMDYVLHPGGSLRIQMHTANVWTSPTVDHLMTIPSPDYTRMVCDWLSGPVQLDYIRFLFVNTTGANASVSLGAAFAGMYLEPARSLSAALTVKRVDASLQRYAMGGQRSSLSRSKYHTVSGRFPLQSASARQDIRKLYETVGATVPVILAVDPKDPSLTFYGALSTELSMQHVGPDLWDMPIDFVEDVA